MTALLDGRTALVTGGSRGIGAAVARALARHGADVAVNYRSARPAADAVVADVTAAGRRGLAVAADATDDAAVAGMVAAVTGHLGDVDLLVCNAVGDTAGMNHVDGSILDRGADLRSRVDVQLAATLACCRHVVPGMRRRGRGDIVLIGASITRQTSVRAHLAEIGIAKAAQDALARHLAAELGPDGIRVVVVAPGMVPTDANAGPGQAAMVEAIGRAAPLRRVSTAEDVAGTVVAVASDLTRQLTGAVIALDGGATMA